MTNRSIDADIRYGHMFLIDRTLMQTSVYVNSSYKPFISNMGKVHKAIEVKQLFCAEGFY